MISKSQIRRVRQLEQKKHRQREALFVAEGPKVVGDMLRAGWQPVEVFATSPLEAVPSPTLVTPDELSRLSFLQHPQQVLALFPLPANLPHMPDTTALTLALDGVQDPGNLGTIIRIADWFAIDTIYCSPDTVDAFSPKVVQATMGSIARVNMVYTPLQPLLSQATVPVYGTLLDGCNIYTEKLTTSGIIVMGNEGRGITQPIRQLVGHPLLIPTFRQGDSADSLNVATATAITLSEFRRRG